MTRNLSWPQIKNWRVKSDVLERRTVITLLLFVCTVIWIGIDLVPNSQISKAIRANSLDVQVFERDREEFTQIMFEAPAETENNQIETNLDVNNIPDKPQTEGVTNPPASSLKAGEDSTNVIGNSPDIEGSFDVPVMEYVQAVKKMAGGKLVIWDAASRRAVGEVTGGEFRPGVSLKNFSTRARDLTDDLPNSYRRSVIDQIGSRFGIWRFVLVVPVTSESQFRIAVTSALAFAGLDWESVDSINLRYGLNDDRVVAHIVSASVKGRPVPVNQAALLW